MSYITKLQFMWHLTFCLAGKNVIKVIQNSTNWNEALTYCAEQNSSLSAISDLTRTNFCETTFWPYGEKPFWVRNFYKLSGRISVRGCYNISNSAIIEGYKTLYECFVLCSRGMNEIGLFAYKAVFESNCLCDHHLHLNHPKNLQMVEAYQCSNLSLFWWVYTVIQNDFNSVHETCRQFTCTDSQVKYDTLRNSLCEKESHKDYHDLRIEIPRENLPYGCERNAVNNNTIVFPDYFRFALNASVNSDPTEKPLIPLICKAISCTVNDSFNISLQNCNSTTIGIICVNEGNISNESINQSSTTSTSSPTTSTMSNDFTAPLKESQQYESTRYDTTASKITTDSTFIQQTSDVPSHSSLGNVVNSHVVFTSHARSRAEGNSMTKTLHITSSKKYSSAFTSSYETDRNERNIVESTPGFSETLPNGHSRIGLIVGLAVAIVVLTVAVVFFVSSRLRRREPVRMKRFVADIQINELNESNYQDDNSNTPSCNVHNAMYDMHTPSGDNTKFRFVDVGLNNSTNIRNNEYAAVVKNMQSSNQVIGQNCDANGENSGTLLESEFYRFNHVRPPSSNNSSNIRNNEYAVVVKNNQLGNQLVEQNCGANGDNSDDMLESEYDRINHVQPRSGNNSSNIYDSALGFRNDTDATYNTTDYIGSDKGDDSVYDHT